jgi:hypothetical protein
MVQGFYDSMYSNAISTYCVAQSLVFCVVSVYHCLSLCPFPFAHGVDLLPLITPLASSNFSYSTLYPIRYQNYQECDKSPILWYRGSMTPCIQMLFQPIFVAIFEFNYHGTICPRIE